VSEGVNRKPGSKSSFFGRRHISTSGFVRSATASFSWVSCWTLVLCTVADWRRTEKVECVCTTTNLPLANGTKIVPVFQRLHHKIVHINSVVQKHDGHTDK